MTAAATLPLAVAGWIRDFVKSGGYAALGLLIALENLFPPIPSELILPLAGFYVGEGTLTFVFAVIAATLGSLAGALVLYAIGRYGGRPALLRWGKVLRLDEARLDRADDWFDTHGSKIVLFGRLLPGVRSIVSIPAGASEMPVGRFVTLTTIGSAVWNTALIGAGVALGSNWEQIGEVIGPISRVLIIALGVGALAGLVLLFRRRSS